MNPPLIGMNIMNTIYLLIYGSCKKINSSEVETGLGSNIWCVA